MESYWSEILTFIVTFATSWGVMQNKITTQQKEIQEIKDQLTEYQKDHDLLIRVDLGGRRIINTIKELKGLIENKRSRK